MPNLQEDKIDPKCARGHELKKEHNFYCLLCNKKFYPKDEYNYFNAKDLTYSRSILDNDSTTIIYRGKHIEHNKTDALQHIIQLTTDRRQLTKSMI